MQTKYPKVTSTRRPTGEHGLMAEMRKPRLVAPPQSLTAMIADLDQAYLAEDPEFEVRVWALWPAISKVLVESVAALEGGFHDN